MNLLLLNTFATDVALKQSLGEHIFWSIWYMILVVFTSILFSKIYKSKNDDYTLPLMLGTIMLILFNAIGLIGHLVSLKYFF